MKSPMTPELTLLQALRIEKGPLALLAALALVFNLLLTGLAPAAHASVAQSIDGSSGVLTLCAVAGESQPQNRPLPGNRDPRSQDQCPCAAACLSSACCGSLAAAPDAIGEPVFAGKKAAFHPLRDVRVELGELLGGPFARAPPPV